MRIFLLIGTLFLMTLASMAIAGDRGGYAIQAGDVLTISVWKEEGLQAEVVVAPDGMVSFPLAGHLKASGKTALVFETELAEKLSKFIPDPVVSVSLRQLSGNKIYVIGKVNRPGEFPLNRSVDVVQALAIAGGLNAFAALDEIKILRWVDGEAQIIPFSFVDIEDGINLEQNIRLQPGDTVVVP